MRELTTHHDGHGLTEAIIVQVDDEIGPGGANHQYTFWINERDDPYEPGIVSCGHLQFQKGPRGIEGSIPGVVEGAVLAVLIDRLECFQAGEYACTENARALDSLRDAIGAIKERADHRAERGVLGTNVK